MKHAVVTALALLLLGNVSAFAGAGFSLEIGCFDPQGGLTATQQSDAPLADGCLGQAILDMGDHGIVPPDMDGTPGEGNAILRISAADYHKDGTPVTFTVNGEGMLAMPGCFLSSPFDGMLIPLHRVFIRVWNAPDPSQATGYWDSPLYHVLPGPQQISFARGEWCWNEFTSSSHKADPIAIHTELSAYPNPFNSSSRISFDLREAGFVKLTVYDLQARLVATLLNGSLAGGHHDLSFDGSALPSGIYFVRLQAGHEVSQVTRLLLLK